MTDLSNRELDAKCAEILGWTEKGIVPAYSISRDACQELLEWAEDSGEWPDFVSSFLKKLNIVWHDNADKVALRILLATPLQICEAFVETFGKEEK